MVNGNSAFVLDTTQTNLENIMPFPVKNFLSTDTGLAPLTSTNGQFIDMLSKCLVDGFNTVSVTAATYSSSTGLFTLTLPAGNGYRTDQIILLSGANEAGYNVEMRVVNPGTTLTAVSHSSDSKPTVGTATGTMSAKAAPQGTWTKPYTGTNKAVFKINAAGSSGCYLRVDNTYTNTDSLAGMKVLVEAYESMTNVDSGTNQFTMNDAGYNRWAIRARTSYRDSPFILISDDRSFYLGIKVISSTATDANVITNTAQAFMWRRTFFGDMVSLHPSDSMCCGITSQLLANGDANAEGSGLNSVVWVTSSGTATSFTVARDIYGTVGKKALTYVDTNFLNTSKSGYGPLAYPQVANSALVLCDTGIMLRESATQLRCKFPGMFISPQDITQAAPYTPTSKITLNGRTLMNMWFGALNSTSVQTSNAAAGCDFIDITGPWR